MNVFDRIYALHKQLADARRPIAKATLEARLECSPATVKREWTVARAWLHGALAE